MEAARAKSLRPEIVKQLLEMAEEGEEFEGSLDSWKMVADCVPGGLSVSILVALKAAYVNMHRGESIGDDVEFHGMQFAAQCNTLMAEQTVHPDIPNGAKLQAHATHVESDESDDESVVSINSLPNLSESPDDESSDDDAGSVHNLTDDETTTDIKPSESAWNIISDEGSTPDAAAFSVMWSGPST